MNIATIVKINEDAQITAPSRGGDEVMSQVQHLQAILTAAQEAANENDGGYASSGSSCSSCSSSNCASVPSLGLTDGAGSSGRDGGGLDNSAFFKLNLSSLPREAIDDSHPKAIPHTPKAQVLARATVTAHDVEHESEHTAQAGSSCDSGRILTGTASQSSHVSEVSRRSGTSGAASSLQASNSEAASQSPRRSAPTAILRQLSAVPVDTTGDGTADAWAIDSNKDGRLDTLLSMNQNSLQAQHRSGSGGGGNGDAPHDVLSELLASLPPLTPLPESVAAKKGIATHSGPSAMERWRSASAGVLALKGNKIEAGMSMASNITRLAQRCFQITDSLVITGDRLPTSGSAANRPTALNEWRRTLRWYSTIVEQKSKIPVALPAGHGGLLNHGSSVESGRTTLTRGSSSAEDSNRWTILSPLGAGAHRRTFVLTERQQQGVADAEAEHQQAIAGSGMPRPSDARPATTAYLDELRRLDRSLQEVHPAFASVKVRSAVSEADAHRRLMILNVVQVSSSNSVHTKQQPRQTCAPALSHTHPNDDMRFGIFSISVS